MPLVSVIMNCYNSDKYLHEALDSVYNQTIKDFEIIFWDNQSTDKSAEIALGYGEQLRYFRAEEFLPLGAARNEAIKRAKGKYLAFLDCDDEWLPEKLEKQVAIMEKDPEIGFVYCNHYKNNVVHNRKSLAISRIQPSGYIYYQMLTGYSIGMLTVLIRTGVLSELDHLFDKNLYLAEEFDLFLRILLHTKAAYIHEPLAIYRVHSNNASIKNRERWPEEHKYIIEKLRKLDTESVKRRFESYRQLDILIELEQAIILMDNAKLRQARKHLFHYKWTERKYLKHNLRFLIYYSLTYLPRSIWKSMRRLRNYFAAEWV